MEYKDLMPNLMVKDVGKTIDFYTRILGFNVLATVPEKRDCMKDAKER